MEAKKDLKVSEIFIENLKAFSRENSLGSIYFNLFIFLSDDELSEQISYLYDLYKGEDSYFKEYGVENWFFLFHKSIRQGDFFSNIKGYRIENKLNESQKLELKSLQSEMSRIRETHVYKLTRERNTEEDLKKHEESYDLLNKLSEYKDLREKVVNLNKIKNSKVDISLGGASDSILWNLIHLDKENGLHKIFLRTFKDIEFEKESNKFKKYE
jgi:hypothetical protein